MVLQYVCIEKCFFDNKLLEEGHKLFLEDKVGDAFPHFRRVDNPVPKEMQEEAAHADAEEGSVASVKADKAEAEAPSAKKVKRGKADDET